MARHGTHFVITANRTEDGAVVYWSTQDSWTADLTEARPVNDEDERDTLIQRAATTMQREVCDPYAMGVNLDDHGKPVSLSTRETIRNEGPTVPYRRPDKQEHA